MAGWTNGWKRWLVLALLGVTLVMGFGVGCNWWINHVAQGRMFDRVEGVPVCDVALVLGTSRTVGQGRWPNPHFETRIKVAAALYHAGRVRRFLLSGDHSREGYDEPTDMKAALVATGVPESTITLDFAGFRTLDSIVRAQEVFGLTRFTIVSEPFHNARSLFICRQRGIDAVAFNARPVAWRVSRWPRIREYLARVKAVLDLYVLRTRPHFIGPKILI